MQAFISPVIIWVTGEFCDADEWHHRGRRCERPGKLGRNVRNDFWHLVSAPCVTSGHSPASTREEAWITAVLLSILEEKDANRKVSGGLMLREWRLNERRGVAVCSSIIQKRKYTVSACERKSKCLSCLPQTDEWLVESGQDRDQTEKTSVCFYLCRPSAPSWTSPNTLCSPSCLHSSAALMATAQHCAGRCVGQCWALIGAEETAAPQPQEVHCNPFQRTKQRCESCCGVRGASREKWPASGTLQQQQDKKEQSVKIWFQTYFSPSKTLDREVLKLRKVKLETVYLQITCLLFCHWQKNKGINSLQRETECFFHHKRALDSNDVSAEYKTPHEHLDVSFLFLCRC